MGVKGNFWISILLVLILTLGCTEENDPISSEGTERNFGMGFTTWSFGPNLQDVDETYRFIANNADVYVEHLDSNIPWNAWINDLPLPTEFTNEIMGRANRKIGGKDLVLSVGLLNLNRDDLAADFDGSIPSYTGLNDPHIQEAYTKHIHYLVTQFSPDYLVAAIEVNELWLGNRALWEDYTRLMAEVFAATKISFPNLKITTSISLHNLYDSTVENAEEYVNAILSHVNQMDFVAISYYPFLKNQSTIAEFQETLDFLHGNTSKPIAIVESGHIAENLIVSNLGVSISGNVTEQNVFLETLLNNAKTQNYELVVWWAHRDYDSLWEVFPPEVRDVGQLWRDTGILDENGIQRPAFVSWRSYFEN